jgi:hypothetical protein
MTIKDIGAAEQVDQTLRQGGSCPGLPHPRLQDRELVAAQAGDRVGLSDDRADALRHRSQQRVPEGVAKSVVNGLEPVEIEAEHGDGPSRPLRLWLLATFDDRVCASIFGQ